MLVENDYFIAKIVGNLAFSPQIFVSQVETEESKKATQEKDLREKLSVT